MGDLGPPYSLTIQSLDKTILYSFMSNTTTRIADLPENITMQMPAQSQQYPFAQPQQLAGNSGGPRNSVISTGVQSQSQDQSLGNAYIPINIHPNPFGSGSGGSGGGEMPLPQNVHQSMDPYRGSTQQLALHQQQDQRLPSRDIPIDSTSYTHDESIQPNYIPKTVDSTDYIKIYEENKNKKLQKIEEEKYRKETAEDLISQFQTPIFVALLYFIFQMPIFNQLLYKYLSVLPIFRPDGNINLYGMLLKSGAFALVYFSMDKIVHYFQYL